jgi:hypothetical protein
MRVAQNPVVRAVPYLGIECEAGVACRDDVRGRRSLHPFAVYM